MDFHQKHIRVGGIKQIFQVFAIRKNCHHRMSRLYIPVSKREKRGTRLTLSAYHEIEAELEEVEIWLVDGVASGQFMSSSKLKTASGALKCASLSNVWKRLAERATHVGFNIQ